LKFALAPGLLPGLLLAAVGAVASLISFAPVEVLMALPWPSGQALSPDMVLHDSYYIVAHVEAVRPAALSAVLVGLAWAVLGLQRYHLRADDMGPLWKGVSMHAAGAGLLIAPPAMFVLPPPSRLVDVEAAFTVINTLMTLTNYLGLLLIGAGLVWLGFLARDATRS
jgi:hypothetical protein